MNPNIRRLIERSGFYVSYENKEVTDKELEALVQLAVRQCASLTLDYKNYVEIVEYFGLDS
jgi:hypothetical protein